MRFKKILLLIVLLGSMFAVFAQKPKEVIKQRREVYYYLIEAKDALTHGNLQKAISLYNQCLSVDTSCATAHYELANIAMAVKDMDVALAHSRAAVKIAPTNGWFQLQLAEVMEARGMLQQAAKTYAALAKLESQNPYYLQKSLLLYETTESWNEALQLCALIQKQYGADFNLLARMQGLYSKAGKRKEGYVALQKLLQKDPENSEYYSLLAMRYQEDGEEKKAMKTYEKIARMDSISGIAQMVLTRYYMSKEDHSKAYKALKGAILSGQVEESANVAAVIGLLQSDTTEQAKQYRETLSSLLIEQYPDNAVGYLFKAQQYGEAEAYEKAEQLLQKALDIDPANYNGLAQLSVIQNIHRNWDTLYATAQKGIEYYPQEHLFYLFKGLAASQKKEYAVAESSLMTSYLYAKDDKTQGDIQELLADVYYKGGKTQKAFDLFEQLLAQNPENVMVLNNYAYFLSLENQQLDKAEEMSRKTIEKEPKSSTYLDTYAWVLYQKGEYAKALDCIHKAIANLKEETPSSEMWEHYGDILYKLGKKVQAKKEWQKALDLDEPETQRLQEKIAKNN